MRSRDFLSYYARQFQTVEIDSTFYGTPSVSTVKGLATQVGVGLPFQTQRVALGKRRTLRANGIVFDGNAKLDPVLVFQDN